MSEGYKQERFSPWNPHNEHRAYYMAHNVLYDMASEYFHEIEKPIIRLKHHDALTAEKAQISGRSPWFDSPEFYFPKWTTRGASAVLDTKCEQWFYHHCTDMIKGMFKDNSWAGIEDAIKGTHSYKGLCNRWDNWFEGRKKVFMEKMNQEVMKTSGVPAKTPSSHGGVANLLKVLTKTMIQRGASLDTIAKIQYAVCTQAGIYIPNEFLTDVAVALDYKDETRYEN